MGTLEGCCTQVSAGLEWRERGFRVRACRGPKSGRGTEEADQSEERAGDWKERWPKDQNQGGFIASAAFAGVKQGMVFQKGSSGVGYYPDKMLPPPEPKKTVAPVDNDTDDEDDVEEFMTEGARRQMEEEEERKKKDDWAKNSFAKTEKK